ncbi:22109_t:CDS:2, partial [Gigaspora rosea]
MIDHLEKLDDLTISLDGWTDVTGSSVYAFLLNKFDNISEVINIEDFSNSRHTANNLLIALEASLKNISVDFDKIIALVTDSPSVIVRLRKNVSEKYPHVIGVRLNFFKNSTYWNAKLKQWAIDNKINHNLQTHCETRWYSFTKVYLSVQNYEEGFKLTTILKYVVDAIGRLESSNTTVGDIFAELFTIYKKLKTSEFNDIDLEFIEHTKDIINFRAKEFDEQLYYLEFFLYPKYRKISVSKKLSFNDILIYALTFAQRWNFTREQAEQIPNLLNDYFNNQLPFNSITVLEPRLYWKRLSHQARALKLLALKIFAI